MILIPKAKYDSLTTKTVIDEDKDGTTSDVSPSKKMTPRKQRQTTLVSMTGKRKLTTSKDSDEPSIPSATDGQTGRGFVVHRKTFRTPPGWKKKTKTKLKWLKF